MTTSQPCNHESPATIDPSGVKFREFRYDGHVPFRYRLSGRGKKLVVLDAGNRDGASAWLMITPQVASFAKVLVVDRTSASGTPSPETAPTPERMIEQLAALIERTGPQGRLVLAGWGYGALIAQGLASAESHRTDGIVLVDPIPVAALDPRSHDDLLTLQRAEFPCPRMHDEIAGLPPVSEENTCVIDQLASLAVPVTVILPGIQPDPKDPLGQRWLELQREDMRRFERVREIIAGRSQTSIPRERPDVVVDAIQRYCLPDP